MAAIEHANMLLDWQENLPREERPPRWMWHLDEQLAEWFREVERKREERYGGNRTVNIRDDDIGGDVAQNELTAGLRRR